MKSRFLRVNVASVVTVSVPLLINEISLIQAPLLAVILCPKLVACRLNKGKLIKGFQCTAKLTSRNKFILAAVKSCVSPLNVRTALHVAFPISIIDTCPEISIFASSALELLFVTSTFASVIVILSTSIEY